MDYTLKLHSSHQTYALPRGLGDLMMDIAREVLRRHPCDIEKFIASYLEALITTREIAKGLTLEVDSEITEAFRMKSLYEQYGITPDEAHAYAIKIQAFFRGWKTRIFLEKYRNKGKPKQQPNRYLTPISDRLSFQMATAAATKIQAVFKGYITRKKNLLVSRNTGDAWRHDWLWTEFRLTPEDIKQIHELEAEKKKVIDDLRLVCIPKRHIEEVQAEVVEKSRKLFGDTDEESVGISEIIGLPEEEIVMEAELKKAALEEACMMPEVEELSRPVEARAFTDLEFEEGTEIEELGGEDLGFIGDEDEGGEVALVAEDESFKLQREEQELAEQRTEEDGFEFETITENLEVRTETEDE